MHPSQAPRPSFCGESLKQNALQAMRRALWGVQLVALHLYSAIPENQSGKNAREDTKL